MVSNIAVMGDDDNQIKLKKVFRELDENQDGHLSKEELSKGMESLKQVFRLDQSKIDDLFD